MSRNYLSKAIDLSYQLDDDDDDQIETKAKCRHIFTDGHRCGSPSLRNEKFCYYHHSNRRPAKRSTTLMRNGEHTTIAIMTPDDRGAIQQNIGNILHGLASDTIDPRRAGLMLYGLQTASHNLPREPRETRTPIPTVDEVIDDPDWGLIAPESTWDPHYGRRDPARELMRKWKALQRGKGRSEHLPEENDRPPLPPLPPFQQPDNPDQTEAQEVKSLHEQSSSQHSEAHHRPQPEGTETAGTA